MPSQTKLRGRLSAEKIVKLYREGVGGKAIAKLHGVTPGSVFAFLRRRNLGSSRCGGPRGIYPRRTRIKGRLSRAEIVELYAKRRLSIKAIAAMDGTSQVTVRRCLIAQNVALRQIVYNKNGYGAEAKKYGVSVQALYRYKAIARLGGCCCKCGCADFRVLQLNHIDGKEGVLGHADFIAIAEDRYDGAPIDVRCANCNLLYEFERGRRQCPPELLAQLQKDKARRSMLSDAGLTAFRRLFLKFSPFSTLPLYAQLKSA